MKNILLVMGCIAIMSLVFAVYGTPAGQQDQAAAPSTESVAAQKAIIPSTV